ncbi:hypothetical protein BWI93_08570 [Siphonobacter sp. BAB-5385]|nr:hypothetical protein BWI93_08570 [Siphonobacter sp. BAB-5385]
MVDRNPIPVLSREAAFFIRKALALSRMKRAAFAIWTKNQPCMSDEMLTFKHQLLVDNCLKSNFLRRDEQFQQNVTLLVS